MKICVIFGGISTEHDVSIVSGTSIIKNLNKQKYQIIPMYIDKNGIWYRYLKDVNQINILKIGEQPIELEKVDNFVDIIRQCDIVFSVLHGIGGEDGSIQGLCKMLNKPIVGCGILASSIGMDKVYTKAILEKAKIRQTKYQYIKKIENGYICIDSNFNEKEEKLDDVCSEIEKNIQYPMFIKPSNSGSSVGIKKTNNLVELKEAIVYAGNYDKKIIIEQGIDGREIECAVIGNENVEASCVGEIVSADDFYSFNAKYKNSESRTIIPAEISKEISDEIRRIAIKAFKAIDGKGLARVDFFVEKNTNNIYLNEINTMPGFTQISMYPKLFENSGIKYEKILDKLIELAKEE